MDEETRLRYERPLREIETAWRAAVGLEPDNYDRPWSPYLVVREEHGEFRALWSLSGGRGATPEEAVAVLYDSYRQKLSRELEKLAEAAARHREEADCIDRDAAELRRLYTAFPSEPPTQ